MLDVVIYTICSNWEGPPGGEADVSQYPLFQCSGVWQYRLHS